MRAVDSCGGTTIGVRGRNALVRPVATAAGTAADVTVLPTGSGERNGSLGMSAIESG